jgi:peptidoglycan/LPS O-acetylase OafA/YrhL
MSSGLFYIDFFKKLIILFGIISSLYLSRVIQNNKIFSKLLLNLSCYSFFVFAFHEPLLTLIKKIVYKFTAPESSIFVTFVYLICPVATIIISIFAYKFLKKISPKFAGLITGGR